MSNHSAAQIQLSKARQNLIIFALSIGAFAIGLSEFCSMGLLLEISRGLGVSESQVGVSISIYALGVVMGAPLLAIFGAGLKRKNLLLTLAFMYALANIASALAPTYATMLIARFISGLPHGAYFGIASLVAASISPPSQKGMAVTKVMLGLSVAILVGNPLAVWLGQQFTWRLAFALVGALAFITVLMVNWSLPLDTNEKKSSPMEELAAFNRLQIWLVLLIGVFGFAGIFTVFSYMATFYDFYGFKGKSENETKQSLEEKILAHVHESIQSKLIPYIQMYEFEGLLFSSPEAMEIGLIEDGIEDWANAILLSCNQNPEEINNAPTTAPSKRLEQYTSYKKTIHGPDIAALAGIQKIRSECAGFNIWLTKLESLCPV